MGAEASTMRLDMDVHDALHIVKLLLTHEALHSEITKAGYSEWDMRIAGMEGEYALARFLLERPHVKRADAHLLEAGEYLSEAHSPLLNAAARDGLMDVVVLIVNHMLRDHPAQQNVLTIALEAALLRDQLEVAEYLCKSGADATDPRMFRMFITRDRRHVIEYLVHLGANVNGSAAFGIHTLTIAHWPGHLQLVRFLLGLGADVNGYGPRGTLLWSIIMNHHYWPESTEAFATMAMRHGADPTISSERANGTPSGHTPFHGALALFMYDLANLMFVRGTEMKGDSSWAINTFSVALVVKQGNVEWLQRFLAAGVDFELHGAALKLVAEHHDSPMFETMAGMLLATKEGGHLWKSVYMSDVLEKITEEQHLGKVDYLLKRAVELDRENPEVDDHPVERRTARSSDTEIVKVPPVRGVTPLGPPKRFNRTLQASPCSREGWVISEATYYAIQHNASSAFSVGLRERMNARGLHIHYAEAAKAAEVARLAVSAELEAPFTAKYNSPGLGKYAFTRNVLVGPSEQQKRNWLQDALLEATRRGFKDIVRLLLEDGARPNREDPDLKYETPLHAAVQRDHPEIMNLLIAKGVDVNAQSRFIHNWYRHSPKANLKWYQSRTALVAACVAGNIDTVKLLLAHGADPNVQVEDQRYTALRAAVMSDHMDIVQLLVEEVRVDINLISSVGYDAISSAIYHQKWSIYDYLLARPELDLSHSPALHHAARRFNSPDVARIEKLLDAGIDVNFQSRGYGTPLFAATTAGNDCTSMMRMLLRRGAHAVLNVRNPPDDKTALQYAAAKGYKSKVELLLRQEGIDFMSPGYQCEPIVIPEKNGWDRATRARFVMTAEMLKAAGAVP